MRRLFGKGAQVIALSEYRGTMRFPLVNEVEAYWEGLRAGRVLPDRAEVDPRGLERALDHVFILERVAPGIVRFRVAGSHLAGLMGMEISGMPLSALFTAAARPALAAHVQRLFDGPQTLRLTLSGEGAHGLYGTMLLLPLRSETGAIGRALGCLVTEGGGARAPCRLRIDAARVKPLPPLPGFVTPAPAPATGFSEWPASFAPQPPATKEKGPRDRRPALRLVRSGD
ncbi:PAS domain-containing protein [Actibacterium sp.]|uniref:PAS domain-containing protein n=1 Tax=Actibacterium sp. TaxID=1872125 RepID=UPI00257B6F24|nr:PAS domain-containing protein [Actibacterium sp.]